MTSTNSLFFDLVWNALFPNPWSFPHILYRILKCLLIKFFRGHATGKLEYKVKDLKKKNEGIYRCIAENEVGVDSINLFLKVV